MSSWYPYRWVCGNCKAVHYYELTSCRRCTGCHIKRQVNNPTAVSNLTAKKKRRITTPARVAVESNKENEFEEESDQRLQALKHSPVEPVDDAVPGTSGETTVRQPEVVDELDAMINDILRG